MSYSDWRVHISWLEYGEQLQRLYNQTVKERGGEQSGRREEEGEGGERERNREERKEEGWGGKGEGEMRGSESIILGHSVYNRYVVY